MTNQKEKNSHKIRSDHANIQTEKVFEWWDYPIFVFLTGLSFFAIAYFLLYWFSLNDWRAYPVSFSIMTLMLLVILANNQGRWFLLLFMKRPIPIVARSGWKVAVVTTFVPRGESLEMLEESIKALLALDYPHDTWVLDEGNDEQVKATCQRLGANHFSRSVFARYQTENGNFQSGSKYGNYNAWLYEIGFDQYEFITAFDPDHVPNPDFLSHVLGYFEDPKVAYVQAAQAYYNQRASFIARGAAEETYSYYSSVQMAGYGLGYPILIGSHNTHRVSALKQMGGFAAHDADDLLLTLLYRVRGWQGVYVPRILARGLTPVDWRGYLHQQRRWARSVLDIKLRIFPRQATNLSLKTWVISFLHGLNYLHRSIAIFMGFILMSYMLTSGVVPNVVSYPTLPKLAILYAVLQLCEFYRQRFYLDWKSEWGLHWRGGVLQLAKWPYFILALYDVLARRRIPYTLTRKTRAKSRHHMLLWAHMPVATLICAFWIIGTISGRNTSPFLHACAAIVVMGLVVLIMTERMKFPHPYEKNLRAE